MKLKNFVNSSTISLLALLSPLLIARRHIFPNNFQILGHPSEFLYLSVYASDLIILAILGYLSIFKRRPVKWSEFKLFPYIFGFLLAIFILSPHETTYSYWFLGRILLLIGLTFSIFYIISTWNNSKIGYRAIISWFFAISGALETLLATYQFSAQKSLGLHFLGETVLNMDAGIAKIDTAAGKFIRPYGTFAHPNILAAFLVVACATAIYLFLDKNSVKSRILSGILLFINIFGIFLTFSRSGIIGFFGVSAIILTWYLLINVAPKKQILISFFILLVSASTSILILHPFLVSRATIQDASTVNRIEYDKTGFEISKKHPILGVGLGNVVPEVQNIAKFNQSWEVQPPHNYFLLVSDETGLPGLVLILILFFSLLKNLWLKIKRGGSDKAFDIVFFSIFCGIIFLMQFDHYFYDIEQGQLLLWIVVGIILAQTRAYNLVAE